MDAKENSGEWQTKKVMLHLRNGTFRQVNARVLGKLAVHQTLAIWCDPDAIWEVSHVPTGYAMAQHLSKSAALKIVEELQCLDWNFERPEDIPAKTEKHAPMIISRNTRQGAERKLPVSASRTAAAGQRLIGAKGERQ